MSAYEMKWFTETPLRRLMGALVVIAGAALLLSIAGCNMSVKNDEAGGKKKVDIETPFGDLRVRNDADAKDTGLPVYPGAQVKQERDGKDKEQASVSMSLFGLRVAVVSFTSDDPQDKVLAWYREQLKPMGHFIECTGSGDPGSVNMHGDSDKDDDKPVSCEKSNDTSSRKVTQLKLGTERNQKVVAVSERRDGKPGTEFALVRVLVGKNAKGDTI